MWPIFLYLTCFIHIRLCQLMLNSPLCFHFGLYSFSNVSLKVFLYPHISPGWMA
uniref:Uncharacterized protein n=1 Tax=Rhizophora mucronata TaxID=61149 RepID=A0A2P2NSP4_RHIMU